jgi:hypothetical protein
MYPFFMATTSIRSELYKRLLIVLIEHIIVLSFYYFFSSILYSPNQKLSDIQKPFLERVPGINVL